MASIPVSTKFSTLLQLDNYVPLTEAVVHATYYASSTQNSPAQKVDLIIPLSTFANNTGDQASVPPGFSVCIKFALFRTAEVSAHHSWMSLSRKMLSQYMPNYLHLAMGKKSFGYVESHSTWGQ